MDILFKVIGQALAIVALAALIYLIQWIKKIIVQYYQKKKDKKRQEYMAKNNYVDEFQQYEDTYKND